MPTSPETAAILVYVTTPDDALAQDIGRALVKEGLAACANILPAMHAIYRWQGKVETADEAVLLLKTTAPCFEALAHRIRALHPYETPCIVALPIAAGDPGYLAWIAAESTGSLPLSGRESSDMPRG